MSQKNRISLSQARALGEPSIEDAPLDIPAQLEIEDAITAALKGNRTLNAPPGAVQAREKLAQSGRLGEIDGYMVPTKKGRSLTSGEEKPPRNKSEGRQDGSRPRSSEDKADALVRQAVREAKARLAAQGNPLWAAPKDNSSPGHPTDARKGKEPYDWTKKEMSGGQVQHRPQVFEDVYGKHLSEAQRRAIRMLRDAWEMVTSVRVTSSRTYTGMPYCGYAGDGNMSEKELQKRADDLALAQATFAELTAVTDEWWRRLEAIVLHVHDERTGRVMSVAELGASLTAYKAKTSSGSWSDSATASGVVAVNDALIRFLEALQAAMIRRKYQRLAKHGKLTAEPGVLDGLQEDGGG